MRNPAPHYPDHQLRRDDDEPAPPWPWTEPTTPQARRALEQPAQQRGSVRRCAGLRDS